MRSVAPLRFVLASASPARLATLRAAGVEPEVIVSGVDEEQFTAATVAELVLALAGAKATAVAAQLTGEPAIVLGCDSLLEDSLLEDSLREDSLREGSLREPPASTESPGNGVPTGAGLGKPGTPEAAVATWRRLRGRTAVLHTGHVLIDTATGRHLGRTGSTEVDFADVSDAEIENYVASGEPLGVAGGFAIDGRGGWFITGIRGDHHNVVGLSLPLLRTMLAELDHAVSDLPAARSGER